MRKKVLVGLVCALALCMSFVLVGCGGDNFKYKDMDATQVTQSLKDAGLPIEEIKTYTEENDPNGLVGRPNGYISKSGFVDSSQLDKYNSMIEFEEKCGNGDSSIAVEPRNYGGTVEVFANEEDCKKRAEYLETLSSSGAAFLAEYSYRNKNVLLRLVKEITPDDAAKYEEIFMSE